MKKLPSRLVALLLVPCFLADPVTAFALSERPSCDRTGQDHAARPISPAIFEQDALMLALGAALFAHGHPPIPEEAFLNTYDLIKAHFSTLHHTTIPAALLLAASLVPLMSAFETAHPTIYVIKLHKMIMELARTRVHEIDGKILILNLDSHDDFALKSLRFSYDDDSVGYTELHGGNWGMHLERLEKLGYYVWLPAYIDGLRLWVSGGNWQERWAGILDKIKTKLAEGDVKEIWLSIDADAYSLRDVEEWDRPERTLPGPVDKSEAEIRADLMSLKRHLDESGLPINRIVIVESATYLNVPDPDVAGYIERLNQIVKSTFLESNLFQFAIQWLSRQLHPIQPVHRPRSLLVSA
jgi:hypothetical protein